MANIFSGMFQGPASGSNANSQALYKSQLEEWEALQEYKRRNEDIIAQIPAYNEATKDMTPERQAQMRFFQEQAGGRETGDKGLEGMASSFKQRGGTIADDLKQDRNFDLDKKLWDYKQQNPEAVNDPAKVATAKFYMGPDWEKLSIEDRQQFARDAWRDRKLVDVKDGAVDPITGDKINYNLIQAGVDKARAENISGRLISFYDDVDDTDNFLNTLSNNRADLKELHDTAEGATGWWSLAQILPEGDANAWMRLRDTVIANIGLDKILALKASSSQGATGLGALNEKELEMLQNHLGNLSASLTPQKLRENIARMDKDLARLETNKMRKLKQQRAWFNRNKVYMERPDGTRLKASDPDLIDPSMERLFTGTTYTPQPNTSDLSTDNSGDVYKDAEAYLQGN